MASIALMIGGAIINATTFVGGSYLAKYLGGSSDSDEEKKRHDLAVETYEKEDEKYEENRAKLNDWIMTNDRIKDEAKKNLENPKSFWRIINSRKLFIFHFRGNNLLQNQLPKPKPQRK